MNKKITKKTAIAPANIAFIKYWGKQDETLRLPLNSSISMNLDRCFTTTTVEFDKKYKTDSFQMLQNKQSKKEAGKVFRHLNRIRKIANTNLKAKIVTNNNFPKSSGIASSASGFAALTFAAVSSLNLSLSQKQLSILSRLGSGSACRSIPDGFTLWEKGTSSDSSYAVSLYPPSYWNLRDIILIVSQKGKETSSTKGMENIGSSPFFKTRLLTVQKNLTLIKKALNNKNFNRFGTILEQDAINMHAVMMTQTPPLFYWNNTTITIIKSIQLWRQENLPVYLTLDAGPNVHLICQQKDERKVNDKIKKLKGIKEIIVNKPAKGAHLINNHLF